MAREPHALDLYVAGASTRSRAARATIEAIGQRLGARCELRVIDVFAEPRRAVRAGIVVTPTVVRRRPEPEIRLSGDLSDEREVLSGLELGTGE